MDADATARGGGVVVMEEEEDYSNQKQSTRWRPSGTARRWHRRQVSKLMIEKKNDKQEEQTAVETATKG